MEFEHLLLHRDGPVVTVTMNRPKQLNALSLALEGELRDCFRALADDDSLRAIVLTGAGRAFCAGVDLKELSTDPSAKDHRIWHGPDSFGGIMRACPHPIICAVNGFAVTGGLEIALLGDFIIAAKEAQFADTHARVGITPAWGMTQALPRLIGINRARQMSLTGEYVGADKAFDWGLANEVVPRQHCVLRAVELAKEIAETDLISMTKIRGLIEESAELPMQAALDREVAVFDGHMGGVSQSDIGANREKVQARGSRLQKFDQ